MDSTTQGRRVKASQWTEYSKAIIENLECTGRLKKSLNSGNHHKIE